MQLSLTAMHPGAAARDYPKIAELSGDGRTLGVV
jgi:hypothetical protein